MKNSSDTIGNRTRDHLTCSAVPLLKAVNNLYLTVDDYGYDYMHILYDLYLHLAVIILRRPSKFIFV
jgi:hypothetical protein